MDSKIKGIEEDPDKRWITTWNDYLGRIKYFYRWMYNYDDKRFDDVQFSDWETPDFVRIKKKKSKRISPYLESELREKHELLAIIKYEIRKRNKAIISLLGNLAARPHGVTLLRIKHIRFKEMYGEGEIPHEAKKGTGPVLLTTSFPYVRDWLNEPNTLIFNILMFNNWTSKQQQSRSYTTNKKLYHRGNWLRSQLKEN